ncbi:MAG: isocitrate/isopropylmalate dehydrogenase family protein, partial [Nitrospirae bacterium]|nr:isocitrate/isopropylmalate dehydrogenase family protein [Nitrospirota bacterium]
MYTITLIPGDGVGPEIAEATRRVIEATGMKINWDIQDAGEDVYQKEG